MDKPRRDISWIIAPEQGAQQEWRRTEVPVGFWITYDERKRRAAARSEATRGG